MKPTHRLKALNKNSGHKTEIGAGWLNEDGSISIVLNPLIVLTSNPEWIITLFSITKLSNDIPK